ncbi:FecR family protein [Bacteroidota bacterium]
MEQKYTKDTFLAKWLTNELTEEDRLAFEKTPAFKDYKKIIEKMDLFEAPNFNKEKVFDSIKNEMKPKAVVKKLIPNWVSAVAASVAIIFGLFFFMNSDTEYTTGYGEQLAVILPDGSKVELNSKSILSLDEDAWKAGKRDLFLKGEGYFKVQKGSKFTVNTSLGKVSVLGTQFNVKEANTYFEVKCFEGKVSVINKSDSEILTPGKGYRKVTGNSSEKLIFEANAPTWITGESTFSNAPLGIVLAELEKQFNIKFEKSRVDMDRLFTGSFSNKNKELALQTVCTPLGLRFEVTEKNTILLSKK